MNDFLDGINWKKINRGLPLAKDAADDRPPTKEEIKKLLEYPDRRIKVIVLVMLSSGIRVGAWDYLNWKHVKACRNNNNKIIAARVTVYAGEPEQYTTYLTPEAYSAVNQWIEFRASFGEIITGDSPLMRDLWQTTNTTQRLRLGLAAYPKRLKSSGVKRLLEHALWEQGIRQPLKNGQKWHEWKAAHGFRKFFETTSSTTMHAKNVALTMGHSIGISESYYKPTEDEVLKDYLNAVPKLTINNETEILNKELELNERLNRLEMDADRFQKVVKIVTLTKPKYEEQIKKMREDMKSFGSFVELVISTIDQSNGNVKRKLVIQLGEFLKQIRPT
jgi:hypothetical protein